MYTKASHCFQTSEHPYREEFKAQDRNDAGQEADDHGADRREHHFTRGSHRYPTGQGGVLDVHLQDRNGNRHFKEKNIFLQAHCGPLLSLFDL